MYKIRRLHICTYLMTYNLLLLGFIHLLFVLVRSKHSSLLNSSDFRQRILYN